MSKNVKGFYILVLALAILALPGCGKKDNQQSSEKKQSQEQNQNQNQANNPTNDTVSPTGEYSINELLTMNKSLKCTWKESTTGASDVTNIIYIDGKRFYQDVTMSGIGHAYALSDGEYLYTWNDFTDIASKMNVKEMDKNKNTQPAANQGTGNNTGLEQKKNFLCEPWSVDDSVFTPPAGKNFEDVTEEMTQAVDDLQKNAAQSQQQICDLCAQAPTAELRTSCLGDTQCE